MKRLLIVGAGGHGKSVLDCALCTNKYDTISFLARLGSTGIENYPLFAEENTPLSYIKSNFDDVVIAIGNNQIRLAKLQEYLNYGINCAPLIHPSAIISSLARIEAGSVILAGAIVGPYTQIGRGCILNSGTVVDHECTLANGVHVSPNAALAGNVSVGERSWICIGCSVSNDITIGKGSVIAAGAAVISDIPSGVLAAGVPAVIKKKLHE